MDIREFVESGFLQEVNRRLLHRTGLALIVTEDLETKEMSFFGIADNRDADSGMMFDIDTITAEELKIMNTRAENVENEIRARSPHRLFLYGRGIQTLMKIKGMLNFTGK